MLFSSFGILCEKKNSTKQSISSDRHIALQVLMSSQASQSTQTLPVFAINKNGELFQQIMRTCVFTAQKKCHLLVDQSTFHKIVLRNISKKVISVYTLYSRVLCIVMRVMWFLQFPACGLFLLVIHMSCMEFASLSTPLPSPSPPPKAFEATDRRAV